jgi:acyl transferase domain-containing protein
MVSEVAKGSMLSVRLDADQMEVILPGNLSIAAVNSNKLCVVAGEDAVISEFAEQLVQKDIPGRLLQTSHAFHSAMMDDIVAPFEAVVRSVKLNPPLKPIISTVTGKRMSEAEATNPAYWAQHLRKTVRFANAVDTLQEKESLILLEVGPGFALATLARQQVTNKTTPIVQGFEKNDTTSEYYSVLRALGQLWLNGIEPDWKAFYQDQQRLKIKLPTYAFDHKRYGLNTAPALNLITPVIETTLTPAESPLRVEETEQIILQKPLTRKDLLISKLKKLFADASGIEMDATLTLVSFIEIGFDSILLMQMSTNLKKEYKVPITIRKLFEEYNTINLLATYLDANLPEGAFTPFSAKPNPEPVFPGSIADSYKDVILN